MGRASVILLLLLVIAGPAAGRPVEALLQEADAAEAAHDSRRTLDLLLSVERLQPPDAALLRRIARQYSNLTVDLPDNAQRRQSVERALEYSRRAVELDPANAEGVLSLAVCYGKLAHYGTVREKVELSRQVRAAAEQALALNPNYAWAHHLLGRWHHEVSQLSTVARLVVRWIYGDLPAASTADAVRHLELAVSLEPDQLQHRLELGFAYLAHGRPEKARSAFQTGLAMASRDKHDEPAKQRARSALGNLPTATGDE